MTATVSPQNLPALDRAVGWIDAPVADLLGRSVGRVAAVLCDGEGRPWWLVLRRRGLRRRTVLAPFDGARSSGRAVMLGCDEEALDHAPRVDDEALSAESHRSLLRHYGLIADPPPPRHRGDCVSPRRRDRSR